MSDPGLGKKEKILYLRKILLEETDENHTLTTNQIINELSSYGISCERKTVYTDIDTLSAFDDDIAIETAHIGKSNGYQVVQRHFDDEELSILCDAVASSRFITEKKSNELLEKISRLTSRHCRKKLRRTVMVSTRAKTENNAVFCSINQIQQGMGEKKKITFRYLTHGIDKKLHEKHKNKLYTVSPYSMVWDQDNYYLVCWSDERSDIINFRIDRMKNVTVTDQPIRELDVEESEHVKGLQTVFSMYRGELMSLDIRMKNACINSVIDRFGDNAILHKDDDEHFICTIKVQISPPFWGWLFQFGSQAQIIAPDKAISEAKKFLDGFVKYYSD